MKGIEEMFLALSKQLISCHTEIYLKSWMSNKQIQIL